MVYDARELHTFHVGSNTALATATQFATAVKCDQDCWAVGLNKTALSSGALTPTHVNFKHCISSASDGGVDVTGCYLVIYSATAGDWPSGNGDFTLELAVDISSLTNATGIGWWNVETVDGDIVGAPSFVADASKDYYVGVADFVEFGAENFHLLFGKVTGSTSGDGFVFNSAGTFGAGPPTSSTGLLSQSHRLRFAIDVTFTTPDYTLEATSSAITVNAGAEEVTLPAIHDEDYWIVFEGVTVADGDALRFSLQRATDDAACTEAELAYIELDMGLANEININVAGGGDVAQAVIFIDGDVYNIFVNVRPGDGKIDVFYQNLTTGDGPEYEPGPDPPANCLDLATRSHAAGESADRTWDGGDTVADHEYVVEPPYWVEITGTGSVDAVIVAVKPVVLLGASNSKNISSRIGGNIGAAFTHKRYGIVAAIGGGRLVSTVTDVHTAGYLRYEHTTPGEGDLCEMTGVVFVAESMFPNDYSGHNTPSQYDAKLADILTRNGLQGNDAIVIGAPYAGGNPTRLVEIQEVNALMKSTAADQGVSFYGPFAMTAANLSTYMNVDELHYIEAGAVAVCAAAVGVYEGRGSDRHIVSDWPATTPEQLRRQAWLL